MKRYKYYYTDLFTERYGRLKVCQLLPSWLLDLNPVQHARKLKPVFSIVNALRRCTKDFHLAPGKSAFIIYVLESDLAR